MEGRAEQGRALIEKRRKETLASRRSCVEDKDTGDPWAVATGGVRSPSCHRTRCCVCVRERPVWPVKWQLRLTSGPQLHFVFSKIFNHKNFEILIGDLPYVQNSPNFSGRQFET
jgi:hypothetical protein